MNIKKTTFLLGFLCLIAVMACQRDDDFIESAPKTSLVLNNVGRGGETLDPAQQLGRVLFYDKALSDNHSVSCGSCHQQKFAFADNKKLSSGMEGLPAARNTPPIPNISFSIGGMPHNLTVQNSQKFFWDGRVDNINSALTMPFFNHVEMGIDHTTELINRVKSRNYYADLFTQAYGDEEVNMDRIAQGLLAFILQLQVNDTPFDDRNSDESSVFSFGKPAGRGLTLFFGKYDCGSCHNLHSPIGYNSSPESDLEMVNIGLDHTYSDEGRADVTNNPTDRGKFKIPNLRNVALTGPYMHDGRFATLDQVIEHYSTGVANHPNLDSRLKTPSGQPIRLHITEQDKKDLIAFLNTLTSKNLITNPLLSDPFIKN